MTDKDEGPLPISGVVNYHAPFTITLTGEISMHLTGPVLALRIKVDTPPEIGSTSSIGSVDIPLSFFTGAEHLTAVIEDTEFAFKKTLRAALTYECILHFEDAVNYVLIDIDPEMGDKREIVKIHSHKTAERLRNWLDIPTKGHRSDWTALELRRAIAGVVSGTPKGRRTFKVVAAKLKESYGEKAPASGEALRKLVDRLGLDWRSLKNGE